jgi:hypothetical protein
MTQKYLLALALICLALSALACATSRSASAAKIADADERMIESCRFLGEVDGQSPLPGVSGVASAKNMAANAAAELGATHIVWHSTSPGSGDSNSYAGGRAYRCEPADG